MKKNESLYWDGYFMALAKVSALRSKDPSTKVGACIVNKNKRVISLGYNGMPQGLDTEFPWSRDGEKASETKYAYVIHAEMNAILNSQDKFEDCVMYTSLFPCSNCAKTISQSGIVEIVYENDKYHDTDDAKISRNILDTCGINTRKIEIDTNININVGEKKFKI
ncbi:cytidine/deoxycytidylate deaminase family protein [Mycoplasma sp. Mirounga ES2805-ORL]|uniref:deoxycytidylate deaminase n=1 Tax=Mycoplasma sp. Mirounga ES2805-ORL TaxID=754514 RepID=UPI00197C19FB|nr:cytidine/deoxycytidylate deaminase family protein [Mycoplasma sp. Mirounga ES2805-ORL]QSF13691.1 cytidine/deoxycytidylate deaminase family protein [Mycoplasma sp. Mirounga ES2805-ORL]